MHKPNVVPDSESVQTSDLENAGTEWRVDIVVVVSCEEWL